MKKFNQFNEMSMSVTLKPKKNNMYKVTGVGKKMAAHGGIKKGEKFHDRDIDGMHDSGIKVKYADPKKNMKKESKDLQELSPSTISSYQKKAGQQYRDLKKDPRRMTDNQATAGEIKGYISQKQADKGRDLQQKMQQRGKGLAMSKGKGMKKEETVNERNTGVKEMPPIKMKIKPLNFKPIPGNPKYKGPANPKPPVMLNVRQKDGTMKKVAKEAIERRMDRKTIIATDPATGRRIVKIAPKKEIKIGKGRMESYVAEISDKMKVDYINKAKKQVTDNEKFALQTGKPGAQKAILKRRKGIRMATGKLGEDMKPSPMKKPDYSKKEVRMGKGVAFDKRYKQGNYSGAYKTINKIKKGLADHPKVADALRRANEEKGE